MKWYSNVKFDHLEIHQNILLLIYKGKVINEFELSKLERIHVNFDSYPYHYKYQFLIVIVKIILISKYYYEIDFNYLMFEFFFLFSLFLIILHNFKKYKLYIKLINGQEFLFSIPFKFKYETVETISKIRHEMNKSI